MVQKILVTFRMKIHKISLNSFFILTELVSKYQRENVKFSLEISSVNLDKSPSNCTTYFFLAPFDI